MISRAHGLEAIPLPFALGEPSTLRRPRGILAPLCLLALCACSSGVEVSSRSCEPVPDFASSMEAVELARCAVPAAATADLLAYGAFDYTLVRSDGRFRVWELIFRHPYGFTLVAVSDGSAIFEQRAEIVEATECGEGRLDAQDSLPLVATATELLFADETFAWPEVTLGFVHHLDCIAWGEAGAAGPRVSYIDEFCGDCYRYVVFDEQGAPAHVCDSAACADGRVEACCG